MATVNETCEFHTGVDQVQLRTQTNGDSIQIKKLKLTQEQATSLAWLINGTVQLHFEIKVKGT